MKRSTVFSMALATGLTAIHAVAAEPMSRVFTCIGPDARMEVYAPDSALAASGMAGFARAVTGAYTLDLTKALKGKHLEPVHLRLAPGGDALVVDQFTRGLPATRIPLAGGTVNFDNRFGTSAQCSPFHSE